MHKGRSHVNLVSLADIISNSIGMLVLFALMTLIQAEQRTESLHVPIEHDTSLSPVFFLCQGGAALPVDPTALARGLLPRYSRDQVKDEEPQPIGYFGLKAAMRGGQIVLAVSDTAGWPAARTLNETSSALRGKLEQLKPDKQFAFFFVNDEALLDSGEGSGFAAFQTARDFLLKRGVKSGWMPFDRVNSPKLCFEDGENRCRFRPAFRADTENPHSQVTQVQHAAAH